MQVGAFEARNGLGALLDRVQAGEEIEITRHGKVVARLVPSRGGIDREQARAAADRIRKRAEQFAGTDLSWETIKSYRDEGRP